MIFGIVINVPNVLILRGIVRGKIGIVVFGNVLELFSLFSRNNSMVCGGLNGKERVSLLRIELVVVVLLEVLVDLFFT